jgi:hypothetical protein
MDINDIKYGDIIVVSSVHGEQKALHVVSWINKTWIESFVVVCAVRCITDVNGGLLSLITPENVSIRKAYDNEVNEMQRLLEDKGYRWDLNLKKLKIINNERIEN